MRLPSETPTGRAPAARLGVVTGLAILAMVVPFGGEARAEGDPSSSELLKDVQTLKSQVHVLQQKQQTLELQSAEKDSQIKSLKDQVQKNEEDLTGMASYDFIKDIEMSGYVSASFTDTLTNPADQENLGRVFDINSHTFTNEAFKLVLEKPTSEESRAGFRVDIFSGRTGRLLGAATTDTPPGTGGLDDFELEQAYITYKADIGKGLDLYAGKFVTLLGAEVLESIDNYNISRSILFGFAIPFTHTGVRATYPLTNTISITGGVNNGWDNNDDTNHGFSYEGQIAWEPNDDFFLAVNGIWGPEQVARERHKRGVIDVVATWKPTDKLTLIGNWDWGHETGIDTEFTSAVYTDVDPDGLIGPGPSGPIPGEILLLTDMRTARRTAEWWGAALVANYQFTDRFGIAGRGEFFYDDDGFRTGLSQHLWEFTVTPHFWLTPKLLTRVEFRSDHSSKKFFTQRSGYANHQSSILGEVAFLFP
jgi:hypothetical protein